MVERVANQEGETLKSKNKADFYIVKRDGRWVGEVTGELAPPEFMRAAERQGLTTRALVKRSLIPGVFFVRPPEDGGEDGQV